MSFDRRHDRDDDELVLDRVPRPAPGLDRALDSRAAQALDTRSRAELAAETADLYKRVDTLQAELKASQAKPR